MEHFLTTLPGIIVAWTAIATGIITGALYVIGLVKGKKDTADDRLIDILQKTVTELEKKVDKQTTDIEGLTKQVDQLTSDKNTYLQILQGKDEASKEFYKQAVVSMTVVQQTHDAVTTMAESIKNTNESIKGMNENMLKMIELLGKHIDVLDHATIKA